MRELRSWPLMELYGGFDNVNLTGCRVVQNTDGTTMTEYWYGGYLHREGGPAVTFSDGGEEWYHHGILHRNDGPAEIYADGTKKWYLSGIRVTAMEVFEKMSPEDQERVLWELDEWK